MFIYWWQYDENAVRIMNESILPVLFLVLTKPDSDRSTLIAQSKRRYYGHLSNTILYFYQYDRNYCGIIQLSLNGKPVLCEYISLHTWYKIMTYCNANWQSPGTNQVRNAALSDAWRTQDVSITSSTRLIGRKFWRALESNKIDESQH